jgi:hypothetical protein
MSPIRALAVALLMRPAVAAPLRMSAVADLALKTVSRTGTMDTNTILTITGIAAAVALVPVLLCIVCGCCTRRKSVDGGGAIGRGKEGETKGASLGKTVDCRDSMSEYSGGGARSSAGASSVGSSYHSQV